MIRRRHTHAPGRHRDGLVPTTVPRHSWDHNARAAAERMDQRWTGWTVLYGAHSRLFYAMAAWPASEPLIICDRTPEGLETQLHDAEMAMLYRRPFAFSPVRTTTIETTP
ncbi:hypothetical protein [Streptosporangium sandarakinum]|uniref:hypothetical protein n=1 Tax=Streptosporangium sandarakinum TaxID=1260955 RepID=UPI0037932082